MAHSIAPERMESQPPARAIIIVIIDFEFQYRADTAEAVDGQRTKERQQHEHQGSQRRQRAGGGFYAPRTMTATAASTDASRRRWTGEVSVLRAHRFIGSYSHVVARLPSMTPQTAGKTKALTGRIACRPDGTPVPLGLVGRHDLEIVAKDYVRADVSHVEGQPRRVLVFGKVIGREAMSQTVIRPICQPGRFPDVCDSVVATVGVFRPEPSRMLEPRKQFHKRIQVR
ncbi:MAG: hypothetical protein WB586_05775 [Chthoniobacterales bacterium]